MSAQPVNVKCTAQPTIRLSKSKENSEDDGERYEKAYEGDSRGNVELGRSHGLRQPVCALLLRVRRRE